MYVCQFACSQITLILRSLNVLVFLQVECSTRGLSRKKSCTLSVEIELKFRNPIWNPKMIQDPIKIFHKHPYSLKLITSPDLRRLVKIIYDVVAITSAHSEWLLFLTNLWSGTKVIFLSDIIATCHCIVCTCDIVTLYIFCVHLSLQRMWFVDCSCEYFSCVFRLTIQTKFRNPL